MTLTSANHRRHDALLLPLATVLVILGVWHTSVVLTKTAIFPAPLEVARALGALLSRGALGRYLVDSLRRVGAGYGLGVVTGIPLGLLLGWYQPLARAVNPLIQMLRPISPLAWMPLAVVWFGVSDLAPIFLIFLAALFPITLATMNATRRLSPVYLQAGLNFGLTPAAMLRRVVFPAILPPVLTGLRIALGVSWIVLVAAEMIAVDSGLGYLIIDSRNAGKRYDLVIGGMLVIGMTGLVLDLLIRRTERLPMVRWGFNR